jgi:two-component system, cell cycle sensor histidine kinase and response regulator CckA
MSDACHILLADDEPALLKMMAVYLERLGYGVTAVDSTDRASRAVDATPRGFAAAVLDATMAGVSLDDLALKILRANPDVRVIVTSGYPVDLTFMQAEAPGRTMFLHKPFTPEMLAATVRRMLGT